jgi:uncharacterized protein DUF4012
MRTEARPAAVPARPRRRRLALAIWAGLATAAILLVLDGVLAGMSLVRNLTRARSELNVGIEAIVTGDPDGARPHFAAAAEAADRATGAVGHPSMGIVGLLPVAGENLDGASGVAEASKQTAVAGTEMADVARTLRWTDVGLPAARAAGSLDLAAMEAAVPALDRVVWRLAGAADALEEAGGGGLLGPVAAGYTDAVENLRRRADLAARLRDALRLAPSMFGGPSARRYLVVVPTLGIARPGGGAPASIGVLVAQAGSLALESIDGVPDTMSPAPPDLVSGTASPDWPTEASRLLEALPRGRAADLEGVIRLDAVALEDLVWISGDVTVQGLRLSDASTTGALEIDPFLGSRPREAGRQHASRAAAVVSGFLERRPGLESFALALADGARDGHVAVYLERQEDQDLVRALGLDGGLPAPREGVLPLIVTWSSSDENHVAAFVETTVRHDVSLRAGGSARVRTEVTVRNDAGTDPPSVLLGRASGEVPVGAFDADVTVYLPPGARRVVAETSRPDGIEGGRGLGYRTITGSVDVPAGTSATLTLTYRVATTGVGDDPVAVRVGVIPQPTLEGVTHAIAIRAPAGASIVSASPGLHGRGPEASITQVLTSPRSLEVRLARA